MKNITLAAAASVLVGLGTAGQAAASVYGGSKLDVSNLNIDFVDASGNPITGNVTGFTFNVEDSATLNGANDGNAAGCGSLQGGCSAAPPVLKVPAANAPGSAPLRGNTDYSLFGPGSGQYANSNAEITTAELVGSPATSTKQVSEAEITDDGQGQASTNIQSNTTFSFNFTIGSPGPASLILSFNADPSMQALVDLAAGQQGLAQSNIAAGFTLNQLTDGPGPLGSASWSPQGTATNDCVVQGGLTCTETNDGADLNRNLGVGPGNGDLTYFPGIAAFGLRIDGLTAGNYSLSLAALTSVNVAKATSIPEPGTLLLLGAGLVMVGGFAGKARQGRGQGRAA